jgi:NAD(P)H-nitrite reductase large subunit
MAERHFVVIGNGPAGNQAAETLREHDPGARVTLMGKEYGGSYRPHLLPDYIAGKITEEALYTCSPSECEEKGIKLRHGQEVVDIDLVDRRVFLAHKEVLSFSGLILAVGGRPRIPEDLWAWRDVLLTLKTVADARVWIERLSKVDKVLLIGGDLTSLAVAKALLHLEKKVCLMLNESAFWPLRYNETLHEEVSGKLRDKGVEVVAGRRLRGLSKLSGERYEIRTDGHVLEVGLIGAFFGLVPDVRFLARTGLRIDRGVVVDEYLNTGFEGVYATGDCAQIYHPQIRDYWVSIGHRNAAALGRVAAANLLGGHEEATAPQESIFDVQGVKVNTSWWMEF